MRDAHSELWFTLRFSLMPLLLVPVYASKSKACCISCEVGSKAMDDAFTIQISSNLVKQLAADADKVKKKRKPKPKTPKTPQQNQIQPTNQKDIHGDSPTLNHPAAGWPPMYLPIPPPAPPANAELAAIRSVLQDSERVLAKLGKKEDEMVVEVTQKGKRTS
ncbi:hypothetical protein L1987_05050 [Smallanthus sonchifolius]|uniref:Uncharacterized protein n=1 Tax=Smallanthus sonchifolius TaxID=185202 RepID=A0ACB9JU98_9ASTR|nr:hypothetical protein L1987_05050 [Smallanthus sonchifolius]